MLTIALIAPPLLFLFGAAVGSLINVVIVRSIKGESVIWSRSQCPHCHHVLRWWELIPLVSFVFLRGVCASCGRSLSVQYPLVEFVMGLILLVLATPLPDGQDFVSVALMVVVAALLVTLFVVDLYTLLLPDRFLIGLGAVSVVVMLERCTQMPWQAVVRDSLTGVVVGTGFLGVLWLGTRGQGIGLGDVKLMIPLGILFGGLGTPTILALAFLVGGCMGVLLLGTKRVSLKTAIPFGPYLTGAALLVLLLPDLPAAALRVLFG